MKDKGFWQMYLRYKQGVSVTNDKCRIFGDCWNDGNMNETRAGCTDPAGQSLSDRGSLLSEMKMVGNSQLYSSLEKKKEAYLSIRVSHTRFLHYSSLVFLLYITDSSLHSADGHRIKRLFQSPEWASMTSPLKKPHGTKGHKGALDRLGVTDLVIQD